MANARKTRARKARRTVDRGDRVKATPETLAKLKPHPLELLLARGREHGGIDADQLQSAEEIADAAQAITAGLGVASVNLEAVSRTPFVDSMSAREEWLAAVWTPWSGRIGAPSSRRPVGDRRADRQRRAGAARRVACHSARPLGSRSARNAPRGARST